MSASRATRGRIALSSRTMACEIRLDGGDAAP